MRTYISTHELRDRYRCSSRTIFRRMKREINPFPPACMKHSGSCNLWDTQDVMDWEEREIEKAAARPESKTV